MKSRVFVSSVMNSFKEFREAARTGIIAAGGEPILVEDFSAVSTSPRNTCLDAVASCDIYLGIIGERGGSTAPSGKLVVQEEYEEAKRFKLPLFFFIGEDRHDDAALKLIELISDYVDGTFRLKFTDPLDLQKAVEKSLKPLIVQEWKKGHSVQVISKLLEEPHEFSSETGLRFVLIPERDDKIIDPLLIDKEDFQDKIQQLAHSQDIRLFSYQNLKEIEVKVNEVIFFQSASRSSHKGQDEVRLEISTNGHIIIDSNVTGLVIRGRSHDLVNSCKIVEEDIIKRLTACLLFAGQFFQYCDLYKRYDRVFYNAALSSIGYRTLTAEPSANGDSHTMGVHRDNIIVAFEKPQLAIRSDLLKPHEQVNRTMVLFRRRLK